MLAFQYVEQENALTETGIIMPKVKRSRKPPPDGWELIEPTIDELDQKMREGLLIYTFIFNLKDHQS